MNEILHANIFFIIASVATVVFVVLISIILFHLIKIMKLMRSILVRIDEGSKLLAGDISNLRSFIANGGIMSWFLSLILKGAIEKKNTKTKKRIGGRKTKRI